MRKLKKLRTLVIYWPNLKDADLAALKGLANLKTLGLGGCEKITAAGMAHVANLTALEELRLGGTKADAAFIAHLKALKRLKKLDLSICRAVDDAAAAQLKHLSQLEALSLEDTAVTDAGLEHLYGLTKLKHLELWCARVSAEGEEKLKKALPNCAVSESRFFFEETEEK